jgi:hypothetical protein
MKSKHSLQALFQKALDLGGNTHTVSDVIDGINRGRFQFWGDDECCVVTEIIQYPQKRELNLFLAAGDLALLLEKYLPQVKEFARQNGCHALVSVSRKGFLKRFPKYGFKPKFVTFELPIEGIENV